MAIWGDFRHWMKQLSSRGDELKQLKAELLELRKEAHERQPLTATHLDPAACVVLPKPPPRPLSLLTATHLDPAACVLLYFDFFGMRCTAHSEVIVAVVVGFSEDRMMDVITGRAPLLARAKSQRSKGSRELARPEPSLLETLGLGRHRC